MKGLDQSKKGEKYSQSGEGICLFRASGTLNTVNADSHVSQSDT